jgi:hypothetical protein
MRAFCGGRESIFCRTGGRDRSVAWACIREVDGACGSLSLGNLTSDLQV